MITMRFRPASLSGKEHFGNSLAMMQHVATDPLVSLDMWLNSPACVYVLSRLLN